MNLVTIDAAGHQLDAAPAAAYARARAAGCPEGITSAYRTAAAQAVLRAEYLASPATHSYAAPVDKSEHVTGNAIDLTRDAAAWMRAHPESGFVFTDLNEWWHVAYRVATDRHLTDKTTPPVPAQETDDMDSTQNQRLINVETTSTAILSLFDADGELRGTLDVIAGLATALRSDVAGLPAVLAAHGAADIAAAIPAGLAEQVVALIGQRLTAGPAH
jgi:hypothetical protein